MPDESSASEREEQLLGQAANEYFAAIARGERPRLSEYTVRYPEIAGLIQDGFPALALLDKSEYSSVAAPHVHDFTAPQQLGDYRLIREIGRGGMGIVYEAEQISISRRVALKVLPFASLAGENGLKRFQNEIRTAASLEHPNIAAVYASGQDRGVHYFAMQLIPGRTLAEVVADVRRDVPRDTRRQDACTDRKEAPQAPCETEALAALSTVHSDRGDYCKFVAKLGIQACEALNYAHSLGVVHRDIKPSNLIVDPSGRLWLTDFGLARGQSDASFTMTGGLVGTLRYMSPEQLACGDAIDQRADIYAVGATLYELAALRPAFDQLERVELIRKVAEEEPPPLRSFDQRIPWELETIVSKAMEKDPGDRYQSASQMAGDLRAFLELRPISAKRASTAQHVGRWARRNRRLVAGSIGMLVALALGLSVSTGLLLAERERTQSAAAEREAVVNFLVNDLLAAPLEERRQNREVTVGEVLENAEAKISEAFKGQPSVEAAVRHAMARSYLSLRRYGEAESHARTAQTLRTDIYGLAHRDTLDSSGALAEALIPQGKFDEARRVCRESYEAADRILGPAHPDAIEATNHLVHALIVDPRLTKKDESYAAHLVEDARLRSMRAVGREHRLTLTAMKLKADLLARSGLAREADSLRTHTLKLSRKSLGERDALTLGLARTIAAQEHDNRRIYEAAELYTTVLDGQRKTIGIRDSSALDTLNHLAQAKIELGQFEEARRLSVEAVEIATQIYGPEHLTPLWPKKNLVYALRGLKRNNESARLQEEVLAAHIRRSGPTAAKTVDAMAELGFEYILQKRLDEALAMLDKATEILNREHPESELAGRTASLRARALHDLGRVDEAILEKQRLVATARQLGENAAAPLFELAVWTLEQGKVDQGQEYLNESIQALDANDWYVRNRIAWLLVTSELDKLRDGRRALGLVTQAAQRTGYEVASVLDTLAATHAELGDFESAIRWSRKAIELANGPLERAKFEKRLETFKGGKQHRSSEGKPRAITAPANALPG